MRRLNSPFSVLILLLTGISGAAQSPSHGLRVPAGFEVTEFADSKLANDIFSMTVDPKGRIVVSGRGYIRILVDDDGDGRADRAIELASAPKEGAQGLLWEGNHLYFMGDGGLRRFHVAPDGDRADGPSELIRAMHTGGEHHAHDIKRGPDGWLYVMCGNTTGIDKSYASSSTSPIQDPVAGCVLRFSPDLKQSEIVADGFRNAYRMDFNPDGELFTFDSDNERCVSLPWYEPTRFYHVVPGGHHGWRAPQRSQFWRLPPYFIDVSPPVATLGRGSPTGVACYRHAQFPREYCGGFFLADWTFGKIHYVPLEKAGSSYTGKPRVFLESVGDNGFAPTDLLVHPQTGDLYVCIGGRGTRGAVYRMRHSEGAKSANRTDAVALLPRPSSLDWQPSQTKALLEAAASNSLHERLRALQRLWRHRQGLTLEQKLQAIRANWDTSDRFLRQATAALIAALSFDERKKLASSRDGYKGVAYYLGVVRDQPEEVLRDWDFGPRGEFDIDARLLADLRLLQMALGELTEARAMGTVWEGYSLRGSARRKEAQKLVDRARALVGMLAPSSEAVHFEWTRVCALLEIADTSLQRTIIGRFAINADPVEDIHYLIVLARLGGERNLFVTEATATALLNLDRKITERHLNRDTNWPLRIAELHAELARKDPKLNAALLARPDFGRPDQALFTRCPGIDRPKAAEIFLARAQKDAEYPWNADLVALMGSLPAKRSFPVLRKVWEMAGLEEAILPVLAREPTEEDRQKFRGGLGSPQLATVRLCLDALEKLPKSDDPQELLATIRALRSLPDGKEAEPLRQHLGKFLQQWTGEATLKNDKSAWSEWFVKRYPALADKLGGADGVDVAAWGRRLAKFDWAQGDVERGQRVFVKAQCASCHSGGQALGPDLRGAANRFSRDDLLTAIIQPSKDISPRYRTTLLSTDNGKVYQGLIIYEAVDGVILQTGAATTVRVDGKQIASRRMTDTSLMPAGLLDKLSDTEIADLLAYLKALK
jgi:putative heme-binding domain-containing protein